MFVYSTPPCIVLQLCLLYTVSNGMLSKTSSGERTRKTGLNVLFYEERKMPLLFNDVAACGYEEGPGKASKITASYTRYSGHHLLCLRLLNQQHHENQSARPLRFVTRQLFHDTTRRLVGFAIIKSRTT